ncbi:MAG: hypothetical protein A2X05_13300 [Bacteroidetes bacterium GWE2_41_25]|nr:MAG: hypothetical protein A2X05_13300 [Bacteroidetes bacterium GWE2_41_25]HCU20448.1 hypothetical protein [Bacteroidales bacterium]
MKNFPIILKTVAILTCLLFLMVYGHYAFAQERTVITRIPGEINFDGIPDEEVWKKIKSFRFIMHEPNNGKVPVQKTDVRLCYDNSYLYLGASLYYSDHKMITSIGKTRDYASWDSDWIGISIDTYNDKQNMILLALNPNGIRTDAATKNDLQNGMNDINFSFNTFWDAKIQIIDSIWYSEIRVPFSSLRFQGNTDKVIMGITLWRNIANSTNPDYGRSTFPEISLTKGEMLPWKASMATEVEFEGLKSKKPIYLTPYILTGLNQYFNGDENKSKTDYKFETGADFKIGLTNNLTLDLTANTDFAQVEADLEQFNLTRFSLFFPEKRLFFQEKADVFDFSFNQSDNLFYSRNIGLYKGDPVRIYGGFRLTGRVGEWDIGLMDMQTAKYSDFPGENFGIFRTKKRVLNSNSFIGGMFTSRIDADGGRNMAYGADAKIRTFGDDYLTLKWAQTFNEDIKSEFLSFKPTQVYLSWERVRFKGLSYNLLFDWSGESYNPSVGIETRDNFFLKSGILRYGWLPGKSSILNQHQISTENTVYSNSVTGVFESFESKTGWLFYTRKTLSGSIDFIWSAEDLKTNFYIVNPDVFVPSGKYNFYSFKGSLYASNSKRSLTSNIALQAGSFYDGFRLSGSIAPSWNAGSSTIINLSYRIDHVSFSNRDQKYTNNIIGLRGRFMFTPKLSLTTYVQYNTFSNRIVTNARIRYNAKEGSDFYLVYNEGIDSSVRTNFLVDHSNENRTILLKYTYTFAL